jgi:hypothetical protein
MGVNRGFITADLSHPHQWGLENKAMETTSAETGEPSPLTIRHQDHNFHNLIASIEHSKIAVADLSVTALHDVLNGVITGEGPTAAGRRHFSRALDPADAALCARILAGAGGPAGLPVTRPEVDVLFEIDAAAAERTDNGRFGDLFIKSVAHCALTEAGHRVPPRQVALAPETELSSWANRSTDIDGEVLAWIASHVRNKRRLKSTLMGLSAFLAGVGATLSFTAPSVVTVVDLVA